MSDAWVYVLRCRDGSLYTGWTNDLDRRVAKHSAGKASRYTASRLPVELAFAVPMPDRGTAMREEMRIKRLARAQKLELIESRCASGLSVDPCVAQLLSPTIAGSSSCSTAPSGGSLSSSVAEPVKVGSDGSRYEPLITSSGEPSGSNRPWRVPK
jgi:putative endonuclease